MKPFFTEKIQIKSKITLIENQTILHDDRDDENIEKIISEDNEISEVFNNYFINIVPNLNISTVISGNDDFIKLN